MAVAKYPASGSDTLSVSEEKLDCSCDVQAGDGGQGGPSRWHRHRLRYRNRLQ